MEGIIKVAPEKLISAAGDFSTKASSVSTLTSNMTTLATGLSSVWTGEAATSYTNKFRELDDDIQRMIRMIQEHSTDLQDMAKLYQDADSFGVEEASALSGDVIS